MVRLGLPLVGIDGLDNKEHGSGGDRWSPTTSWLKNDRKQGEIAVECYCIAVGDRGHDCDHGCSQNEDLDEEKLCGDSLPALKKGSNNDDDNGNRPSKQRPTQRLQQCWW